MVLLLLLLWSFLEMILLLFLPRLPRDMDLFISMVINIRICLNTWPTPFEIYILNLLLEVEVEVKVEVKVEVEVIYLLYLPLHQEVEVMIMLMLLNSTTFLKTLLRIMLLYHQCNHFEHTLHYHIQYVLSN
jgi:hypothetical protein